MNKMNERERFMNCVRFQEVDRVPFTEIATWSQTVDRWYKEGMPKDVDVYFYCNGNEFFGFDRWEAIPLNFGILPPFDYEVIEETERYLIARNGDGSITKALKEGEVRGTRLSMDQHISHAVTDRKSFLEMKKRYDPHSPARYPRWWSDMARCYRDRDYPLALNNGGIGLYSTLRSWMGTENACTVFYDDPSLAEEMLDFIADFFIEFTTRALEDVKVDWHMYFEDFAFKTGPLVSPVIYKKFLLSRYKRMNEHLNRHGVEIISMDSDGNIEPLLPLVIESGFNFLHPFEQAAGMDAVKIRKQYGNAFAMLGSIDKRELSKDKKDIEHELVRQMPFLLEEGGYIPTIDHSVPPDVSYENFLYYLDIKRKMIEGRYGS